MQLEIMKDIGISKVGAVVNVPTVKGVPVDVFWRRRLADAEIDGCVRVITKKKREVK